MTDLPGRVVVECPSTEPVIEGLGVHVARAANTVSRNEDIAMTGDPPQVEFVTIDLKRRMEDDERAISSPAHKANCYVFLLVEHSTGTTAGRYWKTTSVSDPPSQADIFLSKQLPGIN
jgi:hypothetical protein